MDAKKLSQAAVAMGRSKSPAKTAAAQANGKRGGAPTLRQRAEKRVDASPELLPYKAIIMYDWPEDDTHWRWIINKPVDEIIDWAKTVSAE
jgi:hypothetical protein